jgi:CDP-paratose 2-epimerase
MESRQPQFYRRQKFIITGGAGFIGSNTAHYLLGQDHQVVILDNLSRRGSEKNLAWLREEYGNIPFLELDIRDYEGVQRAFGQHRDTDVILHFAAQVAVTTSVVDPRVDFEINALGTFNVLESVRALGINPIILFASTNKVYGEMDQAAIIATEHRYQYQDLPHGISESTPLDFHSPYGCSKGTADQYVRDYHRIYGLRTIVFRNSCIYGPRQFGVEDQGWVAWFCIAVAQGRPITVYGDGRQVRDILYIDDLVRACMCAIEHIEVTQGQVYNIGGGSQNTLAVWSEFGPMLSQLAGRPIVSDQADWRPGDQKIYISDISKAHHDFGWTPSVQVEEGIERLFDWVHRNSDLFNERATAQTDALLVPSSHLQGMQLEVGE